MGGLVSDRFGNRRFVMLAYMLGIAVGFLLTRLPEEVDRVDDEVEAAD